MKIGKMILIALGVALIALGVKGLMDVPGQQAALKNAVWLEEPAVLPENEGKLVVIHGVPAMMEPVHDTDFGLTLNTLKAIRYVEEYAMTSREDPIETYTWASRGSKGLTGKASLGAFELDEKLLHALAADMDYTDFDADQLRENGYNTSYGKTEQGSHTDRLWVIIGGEYYYDRFEYNGGHDNPRIQREMDKAIADERKGDMAVSYRICTLDSDTVLTMAGVQQGSRLVADDALGPVVREGVLTMDQLLSANKNGIIGGAAVFMALGAALVILGVRNSRPNKKEASA